MTARNSPLAGIRVLVAEDEYLIARELRRSLTRAGCADVRVASNLAEAEQIVANGAPQLAVLDIKLADREVYALADRLLRDGVPIVFVTGYTSEVVPDHLSHIPLIQKPFPRKRLLHALETALSSGPGGDGGSAGDGRQNR